MNFSLGQKIEVYTEGHTWPLRGIIVRLDTHPLLGDSLALIEVDSPALPQPTLWVNLRMARVLESRKEQHGKEEQSR